MNELCETQTHLVEEISFNCSVLRKILVCVGLKQIVKPLLFYFEEISSIDTNFELVFS